MLEIKNLVKVYKAKGGAEVRALDNVSVRVPVQCLQRKRASAVYLHIGYGKQH